MKKMIELPKFVSEDDEANWWASRAGREYLKLKSAQQLSEGKRAKGSKMIEQLKEKTSVKLLFDCWRPIFGKPEALPNVKGLGIKLCLR